jgi:hypothetical protein
MLIIKENSYNRPVAAQFLGSITGADTVVAKDIPERAIAVGIPAVPVSFR